MCSSARTPKLQLVTEQPLAGECRIPSKKDTPRPRAKEKQDGRRGELRLESNPIPATLGGLKQTLCAPGPGGPTEMEPDCV